jgi:hypothetical protein
MWSDMHDQASESANPGTYAILATHAIHATQEGPFLRIKARLGSPLSPFSDFISESILDQIALSSSL